MTQNKVAIITGANGGMGQEHTKAVAAAGYTVVMACKDLQTATPVWEKLKAETGAPLELLQLDLANFDSIATFVKNFKERHAHVDLLLNNAGTLCHFAQQTDNGLERTVGVNYVGHYLLTNLLLPLMPRGTRIVNMVSLTYRFGKITDEIFQPVDNQHFNRFTVYSNSKLAFLFFTLDAAAAWHDRGITVNCADPGIVSTKIIRMGKPVIDKLCDIFYRPLIKTPAQGAATMLHLALAKETETTTGQCFANKKPVKISDKILNDPRRAWLKTKTDELLKNYVQ